MKTNKVQSHELTTIPINTSIPSRSSRRSKISSWCNQQEWHPCEQWATTIVGWEERGTTGPIQINFQQILGEVETTTSKIHAWISAQPVIEDDQGAKYMYMYWDGASELQTLHDEPCLSQQRMATFAAAMSKNDKRSNSAYAEAAQAIIMAQL